MPKQKSLRSLRSHLFFFGFPTHDFTDAELEQSILYAAKVFGSAGLTAREFSSGMNKIFAPRTKEQP